MATICLNNTAHKPDFLFVEEKTLLHNLPNVSSLTDLDEPLYESLFQSDSQKNPHCYGNSWAYICQAARYNPLKFFDNRTLVTFSNSRIPHGHIRLIHPIGKDIPQKINMICRQVKTFTIQPILITKLQFKDYNDLKTYGFKDPVWNTEALEELPDDIFPQPICKLQKYFKNSDICPTGSELSKLRGKISRLKKYQIEFRLENLTIEKKSDAIQALKAWKDFFVKRYSQKNYILPHANSYYLDPYSVLISKIASKIDNYKYFSLICYADDIPVGLSLLARISDITVAQYINICSNFYKGLSEYLSLSTFKAAFQAGYKYVNMGGSETKTLFEYNQKFAPESYEKDYYLIF